MLHFGAKFRTIGLCMMLSMFAVHCAAQSNSLVPSSLSEPDKASFREIAAEVPNPCQEASLKPYQTLFSLLDAGQTCHEASILSSEITFLLGQGIGSLQVAGMVKAEAKEMADPHDFKVDNRPRLGDASAPVEVVVFSDFQCPYCARAAQTIHKAYEARHEAVSFVFKQLPLTGIHTYAAAAALVSVYAHSKDKFWEIHDRLFEHQRDLNAGFLADTLESMGASTDDVFDPVKGQPYGIVVIEDMADAADANVGGTPSFFVNGVAIEGGGNYNRLIARIDAELAAPAPMKAKSRAKKVSCPFKGHEESYAQLEPADRASLSLLAGSVFCPCAEKNNSLHDCAAEQSCDKAEALIDLVISRLLAKAPQDAVLAELEAEVALARGSNP